MILEKLMALICEELGMDSSDIDENSLLDDLFNDEFELQEFAEVVNQAFEIEVMPETEWSISDYADAVSQAY